MIITTKEVKTSESEWNSSAIREILFKITPDANLTLKRKILPIILTHPSI